MGNDYEEMAHIPATGEYDRLEACIIKHLIMKKLKEKKQN